MGFLAKLFAGRKPSLDRANRFLDEAERIADNGNPLYAMEYMERESKGLQKFIGPDGPLNDRFIRILHKIKSRVFASNSDAPRKAERNWDNLPSTLQIPLFGEGMDVGALIRAAQAKNMDIVWLVPATYLPTQQDAKTMIDYTFHFADDHRLVLQFHEWNGNILIRRSFLLEISPRLNCPTVGDLLVDLMKVAHARGLRVTHI